VGQKSHDRSFYEKYMEARVITFVDQCTLEPVAGYDAKGVAEGPAVRKYTDQHLALITRLSRLLSASTCGIKIS